VYTLHTLPFAVSEGTVKIITVASMDGQRERDCERERVRVRGERVREIEIDRQRER
jgi:hypothetical protein